MTFTSPMLRSFAAVLLVTQASFAQQPNEPDPVEYRSYLAHVTAAGQALRLSDTAEAQRWLAKAPVRFRGWEWHYLRAQANQHADSLDLQSPVTALALSPDGKWLAGALTDRSVRVVDAVSGRELFRFTDSTLAPLSLAFAPDGKSLAGAFSGHVVIVWDLHRGSEVRRLQGQGKGISAVAFSPDGRWIAASSWDRNAERGVWGIVDIWDAATGAVVKQLEYGTKPLVAIAFSPNGNHLAVASWESDKIAALWEVATWSGPQALETEGDAIYKAGQTIAFSPDSTLLAVGGKDSAARIWNVATRRLVHKLGGRGWGHSKWVNGIAFSPDGATIATASTDQTIRLWNVQTGQEMSTHRGHVRGVSAVAFAPGGRKFYSGGSDATLKTWDIDKYAGAATKKVDGPAYGIAFSPDGRRAVSAHWRGKLRIWNLPEGTVQKEWLAHDSSANAAAFTPDGKRLVSVGNDGRLTLWEADSAAQVRILDTVEGLQLVSVAVGPDGRVLSAASRGAAKLWELSGPGSLSLPHPPAVTYVAVSPDGSTAATGGADGSVKLWALPAGSELAPAFSLSGRITCLAFSPDGTTLAASTGRAAVLIDVGTQQERRRLEGHLEAVNGVAFSPDGSRVVTSSSDQNLKLWDPRTGEVVLTIPFASGLWNAAFHPDGRRLYVLPLDSAVIVLDAGRESWNAAPR